VLGASHPLTLADVAEFAAVSPRDQAERLWMRAARSPDALVAARALAAVGQVRESAGDRTAAARFYRDSLAKLRKSPQADAIIRGSRCG